MVKKMGEENLVGSVFIFACLGLIIGVLGQTLNKAFAIPFTPILIIAGIAWGLVAEWIGSVGLAAIELAEIPPVSFTQHAILMIFIPTIIFESSLSLDWYTFRQEIGQILILAAPGVLITTVLTGIFFRYILDYADVFSWGQAFMLGSILSATDPVAVVSLLKELGTSKQFSTIIEGESVVNDGTAMVLFIVMLQAAKGEALDAGAVVGELVRLSLGGPAMGVLFGVVMAFFLKRIHNYIQEVTITLLTSYLLYFTCEFSGARVSGILGLLSMGLYMSAWGKSTIAHETEEKLHHIWKFLSFLFETLLFILAGIIIGVKVLTDEHITAEDWGKQFAFLFLMEINRGLMVLILYPFLYYWGYRISWRQALVITHAGLRGSIALSLALIVSGEDGIPTDVKHLVLFHTAGIAIFSIIINGSTTKYILVKLGLTKTTKVEEMTLINVVESVLAETKTSIREFRSHRLYTEADWASVKHLIGIREFAQTTLEHTTTGKFVLNQMKHSKEELDFLDNYKFQHANCEAEAILKEIRHRYLTILRGLYWQQYKEGQASAKSAFKLIESVDRAIDFEEYVMEDWEYLEKSLIKGWYLRTLLALRSTPLIGRVATTMLYDRLAFAYEVAITFKLCHKWASKLVRSVISNTNNLDAVTQINAEARTQVKLCGDFIRDNISDSVSDAVRVINTNQIAYTVLCRQAKVVEEYFSQGMITDKEFNEMMGFIDKHQHKVLGNTQFRKPNRYNFLRGLADFEGVSDDFIKGLAKQCKAVLFNQGETILRDNESPRGIYLLMRGSVKEVTRDGKGKFIHAPGSFMSSQHVFFTKFEMQSSLTANSSAVVIPIPKNILEKHDFPRKTLARIERFAASVTLKLACHDFPTSFSRFDFEDWLNFVIDHTVTMHYKGSPLNLPYGGLLLSGDIEGTDIDNDEFSAISFVRDGEYKCKSFVKLISLRSEVAKLVAKASSRTSSKAALLTLRPDANLGF
jgi:NhaP-type Na+/H+ or K+/H+ antiporter